MENNVQHLGGTEAIKKIKELAEAARSCMMLTRLQHRPISVRPMGVQKADDDANLYFFTDRRSEKHREIIESNEMQLTFSNDKNSEYMNLYGHAQVYRDQAQINDMYTIFADTWFKGKEDPNLEIIKFIPESGHYWDSKAGKLVQMAGFLVGAITGNQTDNGRQGDLSV